MLCECSSLSPPSARNDLWWTFPQSFSFIVQVMTNTWLSHFFLERMSHHCSRGVRWQFNWKGEEPTQEMTHRLAGGSKKGRKGVWVMPFQEKWRQVLGSILTAGKSIRGEGEYKSIKRLITYVESSLYLHISCTQVCKNLFLTNHHNLQNITIISDFITIIIILKYLTG